MSTKVYILDKRTVVGNCALFLGEGGQGYTCELNDAGLFDPGHSPRDTDIEIPEDIAEECSVTHVRLDTLRDEMSKRGLTMTNPRHPEKKEEAMTTKCPSGHESSTKFCGECGYWMPEPMSEEDSGASRLRDQWIGSKDTWHVAGQSSKDDWRKVYREHLKMAAEKATALLQAAQAEITSLDCERRLLASSLRRLEAASAGDKRRITELETELETERMRLVACGVAAMCNTAESIDKQSIGRDNPYWSASYGDVRKAVDREISHRGRSAEMEQERDLAVRNVAQLTAELAATRLKLGNAIESANDLADKETSRADALERELAHSRGTVSAQAAHLKNLGVDMDVEMNCAYVAQPAAHVWPLSTESSCDGSSNVGLPTSVAEALRPVDWLERHLARCRAIL